MERCTLRCAFPPWKPSHLLRSFCVLWSTSSQVNPRLRRFNRWVPYSMTEVVVWNKLIKKEVIRLSYLSVNISRFFKTTLQGAIIASICAEFHVQQWRFFTGTSYKLERWLAYAREIPKYLSCLKEKDNWYTLESFRNICQLPQSRIGKLCGSFHIWRISKQENELVTAYLLHSTSYRSKIRLLYNEFGK